MSNDFTDKQDSLLISIVVPIYNVERYLPKCIDSVLSQSFRDFELILIDDGSPDNSGGICDRYAQQDNRIKVIHKENGGLSHTRNVGIEKASGEYICFLDSDDYMLPGALETLYNIAQENDSDIVMAGYKAVIERNGKEISALEYKSPAIHISGQKEIAAHLLDWKEKILIDPSWNKLYKLEMIKKSKVLMPEGELYEDTEFNLRLLPYVNSITNTDFCVLHYMQRNTGSITKSFNPDKIIFLKKRQAAMIDYFKSCESYSESVEKRCNFFYIKYIFSCFVDLFFKGSGFSIKERRDFIKKEISEDAFCDSAIKAIGIGKFDNIVCFIARCKNVSLIYIFSGIVFLLKFKLQNIFLSLKRINRK